MLATAREMGAAVNPWEIDFLARQRQIWVEKGGVLDVLPPAEKAELMAKTGSICDDIVRTKPELQPLWSLLKATAQRTR